MKILYGEEEAILICLHGLALKIACVNINNNGNKWFEYSVKCGWYDIHTNTNPQRISYYKDENFNNLSMSETISFECCAYPMKICDETIRDFEISNDNRVSIDVYQVHQTMWKYINNEFDSSEDVLNKIMI